MFMKLTSVVVTMQTREPRQVYLVDIYVTVAAQIHRHRSLCGVLTLAPRDSCDNNAASFGNVNENLRLRGHFHKSSFFVIYEWGPCR
jgi:hypothetical protein